MLWPNRIVFGKLLFSRLQEQDRPQRLPLYCFWKIVVRRLQDAHSMASTYPYAGGKEYFALLTVCLWLSKSNPGLLYLADWSIRTFVNSLVCLRVPLANLPTCNPENSSTCLLVCSSTRLLVCSLTR